MLYHRMALKKRKSCSLTCMKHEAIYVFDGVIHVDSMTLWKGPILPTEMFISIMYCRGTIYLFNYNY